MGVSTIWTTTEKIWWDDNTDNKPNDTYFTNFVSRMSNSTSSFNLFQKDKNTIEVVVPNTNITYIRVNDTNNNYYYYYNKIINVLPEGYRIEYKIDLYTTYTLPYIKWLTDQNIKVKINRHKRYELEALQVEDDMLNAVPKIVANRSWNLSRTKEWVQETSDSFMFMRNIWGNDYLRLSNTTMEQYNRIANTSVYVAYSGDDSIVLVPAMLKGDDRKLVYKIESGDKPRWYTEDAEGFYQIRNYNANHIVKTLVEQEKASKIIGLFLGPPFYMFKEMEGIVIAGTLKVLGLKVPASGYLLKDNTDFYPLGDLPSYLMKRGPKSLNETGSFLSMYAANTINISIAGRKQPIYPLIQPNLDNNLYFGELAHMTFTTNINLLIRSSFYPMNAVLMNYPADLPMFINKYQEYLQNTKATRDTSLSIAKQNTELNTGFGIAGGLLNVVSSVASGNPLGAVNSIFSTIQSTTKNVIGLEQKKEMLNAELKDKQTSLKSTVQSGVLQDTAIASYILSRDDYDLVNSKVYMGDFIEFDRFNESTTKALNNILYLYGVYNPRIDTLSNLTALTIDGVSPKFDYYKFDAEYLTNIFATTLRGDNGVPIEREHYNYIYNQLISGVRLWKETPEY